MHRPFPREASDTVPDARLSPSCFSHRQKAVITWRKPYKDKRSTYSLNGRARKQTTAHRRERQSTSSLHTHKVLLRTERVLAVDSVVFRLSSCYLPPAVESQQRVTSCYYRKVIPFPLPFSVARRDWKRTRGRVRAGGKGGCFSHGLETNPSVLAWLSCT